MTTKQTKTEKEKARKRDRWGKKMKNGTKKK